MSYLLSGDTRDTIDVIEQRPVKQLTPTDYEPDFTDSLNLKSAALAIPRIAARSALDLAIPVSAAVGTLLNEPLGLTDEGLNKSEGSYDAEFNDFWHKNVTDNLIRASESLLPDPQTTHVSLQIADQFLGMVAKFAAVGGVPFAVSSRNERAYKEMFHGKSADVAEQLGNVEGATNLLGVLLPGGVATKAFKVPTRLQGAATGAAINVGLGVPSRIATSDILEEAGYHEEAKQFAWNDAFSIGLDAAMGGVFGAFHQHVLPSHVDALFSANDAHAIEHPDGITALEPKDNNALVSGMTSAIRALEADETVKTEIPYSDKFIQDFSKDEMEYQISRYLSDKDAEDTQTLLDEFYKSYPDVIQSLTDSAYKDMLQVKADQAGWAQKGGELLRDIKGEPVGRTTWEAEHAWFKDFIQEGYGGKKELQKAVGKFIAGEKLGPKQEKIIEWLKDEIDGKHQEGEDFTYSDVKTDINKRILVDIEELQKARKSDIKDKAGQLTDHVIGDEIIKPLDGISYEFINKTKLEVTDESGKKIMKPADELIDFFGKKIDAHKAFIDCLRG